MTTRSVRFIFIIGIFFLAGCGQTPTAPDTEKPIACTADAKVCPDGSAVGRTGLNCEFAACPEVATNSTVQLQTFTDTKQNFSLQYPAQLSTTYITAQDWPPKVTVSADTYSCKEGGAEIQGGGQTKKETMNNQEYCVTTASGGAAGSTYTTYTYETDKDGKLITLIATLREVQCDNYDDAKKVECKNERAVFNFDSVVDAMVQSITPLSTTNTNTSMEFNAEKHYTATLHTDKGDIEIALNFGQTPNTVKNFVDLSRKNFYDNTIFHRVLSGFMIQGGDPEGTGRGGPGYKFADEPFTGEYTRGTVAMANAGPNTNGSQFFIMHADYPLPKNYTIFGHVMKGLDVVDKIANSPVTMSDSGEPSKPVTPTVVSSVDVKEE